jgi:hypothetical protein
VNLDGFVVLVAALNQLTYWALKIFDLRLKHNECWCIALSLFLQMVPQRAGLVGFYGFGGFEKKLFNLESLNYCRRVQ